MIERYSRPEWRTFGLKENKPRAWLEILADKPGAGDQGSPKEDVALIRERRIDLYS